MLLRLRGQQLLIEVVLLLSNCMDSIEVVHVLYWTRASLSELLLTLRLILVVLLFWVLKAEVILVGRGTIVRTLVDVMLNKSIRV
jgi:hypothetical protein